MPDRRPETPPARRDPRTLAAQTQAASQAFAALGSTILDRLGIPRLADWLARKLSR